MSGHLIRSAITVVLLAFAAGTSFGAVPQMVNYQGYLADSSGAPVDGSVSFTFRIFTAASDGTKLWEETQTVSVSSGVYSVQLGTVTGFGATVFNGTTRYLEIEIGGTPLSPRQPLTSAGFALRAGVADSVADGSGSGLDADLLDGQDSAYYATASSVTVHASDTTNPHGVTATQAGAPASIDGVANAGGDIDLSQGGAITITPDDPTNVITISETHSTRTDNPHSVTAAQSGSLPAGGGTLSGSLVMDTGGSADLTISETGMIRPGDIILDAQSGGGDSTVYVKNTDASYSANLNVDGSLTVQGNASASAFSGSGSGLTGLNASNLSSGSVSPERGGLGMDTSSATTGSILYTSGTGTWSSLSPGSDGLVLKLSSGVPAWSSDATGGGGTVTQVDTGTGLTGGPITSTGTVSIDTSVVPRLGTANTFSTGTQTINTGSAANRGLVVNGASGQSANLQEWQVNGSAVAEVYPSGAVDAAEYRIGGARVLRIVGGCTFGSTYCANTYVGDEAGGNSTSGYRNVFVGSRAGYNTVYYTPSYMGADNTFIGIEAGYSNTNAYGNTAIGSNAGYSNQTGISNVCVGSGAGKNNTAGYNTYIGASACYNCSGGGSNVVIGYAAGSGSAGASGQQNVFVGNAAGNANTTGSYNTYIGNMAGKTITTGTGNIFIGNNAGSYTGIPVGTSNRLFIENSTISNPLIYGEFDNDLVAINGDLGVGTTSLLGYDFYVNGSAYSTGGWAGSDGRFKTQIAALDSSLDKVLKLKGVSYAWNRTDFPDRGFSEARQIGLIAQDVEPVLPELVRTGSDGYKAVSYEKMVVVLIEAIKEQQAIIDRQDEKITILMKEMEELKERMK